jgi:folate-binding protein YgfZ
MNVRTDEFRQRLERAGAQWSERGEVSRYGDVETEWRAVRLGGVGLADRSTRETLVMTGPDAIPWLQGLVTNDLFALAEEGSAQRTHAVNRLGRAIADARVVHVPDHIVIDLEPGTIASGFLGHLRRHIITEDVRLADVTATTGRLGVYGLGAGELLGAAGEWSRAPGSLTEYEAAWGEVAGEEVIALRAPLTGEPSYELFLSREGAARVWAALSDDPSVRHVGEEALEELRREAGVPRFGVEYDEKVIPIEADLNDTISYDKGCYLGQEIVHRLDTKGKPAKFLRVLDPGEGVAFEVGDAITAGGKKVGEVRDVFASRSLGRALAHAYVKRGAYDVGARVEVAERGEATVRALGWALASG